MRYKILTLTVIMIFILAVSGCTSTNSGNNNGNSQSNVSKTSSVENKTYKGEIFTFDYPKNWNITKDNGVVTVNGGNNTKATIKYSALAQGVVVRVVNTTVPIAGTKAVENITVESGIKKRQLDFTTTTNNTSYMIKITFTSPVNSTDEKMFDMIVDSFKMK